RAPVLKRAASYSFTLRQAPENSSRRAWGTRLPRSAMASSKRWPGAIAGRSSARLRFDLELSPTRARARTMAHVRGRSVAILHVSWLGPGHLRGLKRLGVAQRPEVRRHGLCVFGIGFRLDHRRH